MKVLDLEAHPRYIPSYVALRNANHESLLSGIVTEAETVEWLKRSENIIRIAVENDEVMGVCTAYRDRNFELAIFVREKSNGIGTLLVDSVCREVLKAGITVVWAWIADTNTASQKLFLKCGFVPGEESLREYRNESVRGKFYRMNL